MNENIVHRGPDDEGYFHDRAHALTLAMRRLAILDIAGGHQPMSTPDGRFTIVFNGEIYNAPSLRDELKQRGIEFHTDHSDTEVLLHLYAHFGESALLKLNGMFAFAVYDRDHGQLFLARDRLGIKPMYYTDSAGRFAFASELKALLALPFIEKQLDEQSLFHYMTLMYVPGERTIISNIQRLPAGHCLTYRLSTRSVEIRQWWRPQFCTMPVRTRNDWTSTLREALTQAVSRWSLSDVPIGCSLSGGLDSTSIAALLVQAGHNVQTYSVGFTGPGEEQWNELPLARKVAEKWGTEHHELVLDPESLLEDLLSMVWHLDEPYGGGLPSWVVFRFMSHDVKVGMTGTGGDELFGNYGKWRQLEGGFWRRRFPKPVTASGFEKEFSDRFYYLADAEKRRHVFAERYANATSTASVLYRYYDEAAAESIRDRSASVDISTQLPEEFLMMTDRLSMAHSLEARTPFLDHEFAELVLSVPSDMRTTRGDLKGLLRSVVADLLPPEVLHAPKKGFVIPLKLWLRGQLRGLVECLLSRERLKGQGILQPSFYDNYVKPHLNGSVDNTQIVWAALMFQLWHHVFLETGARRPNYTWKALIE